MKNYSKPPLTFEEQVDLLEERGLTVSDREYAINFLKRVNYYRLSAYFIPFQPEDDTFETGATFRQIVDLYQFDSRLRTIIADVFERVEVFIGTTFAHVLSHEYDQFFHENKNNFFDKDGYEDWIERLHKEIHRSHEKFIQHYKNTYSGFPAIPLWMAVEVMTLGSLSFLYTHLMRKDQVKLSKLFGQHHSVTESWLHTFTYVRNVCAHHNRLWNRQLSISMKVPKNENKWDVVSKRKVGAVILAIGEILKMMPGSEEWVSQWKTMLRELFNTKLPLTDYWRSMGITSVERLLDEI